MKIKTYKCPFDNKVFTDKNALYEYIEKQFPERIPKGMSVSQLCFNLRNDKTHGSCIICGSNTDWNEKIEKYNRLCSERCSNEYREMFRKRMINVHGKDTLLNNPEQQKLMLAHRKISGTYLWSDGKSEKTYTGSYELAFLEFIDKFMGFASEDVFCPAPQVFEYIDSAGKKRFYIPDVYIATINTLVELKDGGSNPNRHHKIQDVDKDKEKRKDDVMRKQKLANYVKITDKNHAQFINFLLDMKDAVKDEKTFKPIIAINESMEMLKRQLTANTPEILGEMTTGIIGDIEKLASLNANILENNILSESFREDYWKNRKKKKKDKDEPSFKEKWNKNVEKAKSKLIKSGKSFTGEVKDMGKAVGKAIDDGTKPLERENTSMDEIREKNKKKFALESLQMFPIGEENDIIKSIENFKRCPVLKKNEVANKIYTECLKYRIPIKNKILLQQLTEHQIENLNTMKLQEDTILTENIDVDVIISEAFNNLLDEGLIILDESFNIGSDGEMVIRLREKTNFMSKYSASHKLMKIYMQTSNLEGIKHELCKLYYMYLIIEEFYGKNNDDNFIKNFQKKLLAKNKNEALKAKAFILNDFTQGLKFILDQQPDFIFDDYFQDTDYYRDIIKINPKKIDSIKKLLSAVLL